MSSETLITALTALNAADENDKAATAGAIADLVDAVFGPILLEQRKHTLMLEVLMKQGEEMLNIARRGEEVLRITDDSGLSG